VPLHCTFDASRHVCWKEYGKATREIRRRHTRVLGQLYGLQEEAAKAWSKASNAQLHAQGMHATATESLVLLKSSAQSTWETTVKWDCKVVVHELSMAFSIILSCVDTVPEWLRGAIRTILRIAYSFCAQVQILSVSYFCSSGLPFLPCLSV
jgi:hypothetical protein